MFRDIQDTIKAYGSAFGLARRYGLYKYLWLSGIISLSIGAGIVLFLYFLSDDFGAWIAHLWRWEWGQDIFSTISTLLSGILIGGIGLFTYKYIVMIVVAPIMSPLSERLEEHMRGCADGEKLTITRLIGEMIRGIRVALRNIIREIFYTIVLLLLSLIPGAAFLTTPTIYGVQAYYAGFGNMDYCLERHYNVRNSVRFVRKFRWAAVANGLVFLLILLIPIVGLFLAPFLSTIAGTVVVIDRLKD